MSSSQQPEISIPVPVELTSTSTTLPPPTSQALIAHLRATGDISSLSGILSDSLARTGWTDRVRALSLELLRNGTCDTFPELMSEVLRRAKIPRNPEPTTTGTTKKKDTQANGTAVNGNGAIVLSKEWSGGPDGLPDVRIPESVVATGVDFLKEKIKDVVEPVEDDSD
ncbi:hypothetical protein LTR10_022817 [Elasticomyces elasticus]|uniref:Uncharacterized protein n=1 Tax=Exophiala sideris TaxID=1016849 RepID=A0ABR0JHD8_9EURO|nr:hypothetical protein LTR10_022817 [Elasticomyces elasticus]KAK5033581.1 hypothetical protein LTS07_003886 [Exophiala sideris]KAK5041924.1 hypothetical protein LTR13_001729 [Exophiala sideris]KAK5064125.1 hypothetical protein LTR69_003894 [Exophiala sideris]KAK5185192.1 hypothetical protein LTR44_002180 [Eurotiomycetes sp. CCFEE 6388]